MQTLEIDNRDGRGFVDYTRFLDGSSGLSYQHSKNDLISAEFVLTPVTIDIAWKIPARGAYVRFIDDAWESRVIGVEDGVVFTGYITDDPFPELVGAEGDGGAYSFKVLCSSDEYLANLQDLPQVTYVNKTRGFILRDLLSRMFASVSPAPYNTSGIMDGGVEQLYSVNTDQNFTDVAREFAEADGFAFWCIDKYFSYAPQKEVYSLDDPAYRLVIDDTDPRFNPTGLSLERIGREIVNDVTVIGEDEASSIVNENFVSDGFQGSHRLSFDPYGIEKSVIIEDDLTSEDIDDSLWEEEDPDSQITPFEGKLNITGGPADDAGTVFLRSRRAVELGGIIEFRDGEVSFPSSVATGEALIGGLFTSDSTKLASCWSGWKLDLDRSPAPAIYPVSPDGIESNYGYPIVRTRSYILRRTVHVDTANRHFLTFTQASTGSSFGSDESLPSAATITWSIDEIIDDDPENVYIVSRQLLTNTFLAVPDFVLHTAVVPWSGCQMLLNNVMVSKPQQAFVKIDGKPARVGSYLDGGRCALLSEGGVGKLAWYSVPGNDVTLKQLVLGRAPRGFWTLGDVGGSAIDSSGFGLTGTLVSTTTGAAGALGAGNETSMLFNGTSSNISLPAMATTSEFSVRFWFKTNSAALMPVWSNRTVAGNGVGVFLSSGSIHVASGSSGITATRTGLNDGNWHRCIVTFDGTDVTVYVDGVLDTTVALANSPSTENIAYISHDLSTDTYFNGWLAYVSVHNSTTNAPTATADYARGCSTTAEVVTIPPKGSKIDITYYRKRQSAARVRSTASIATEQQRYGDSGLRQKILRLDDVQVKPRTSEECQYLAEAFLADNATFKYRGSYTFSAVNGTNTALRYWPMAGDMVWCDFEMPGALASEQIKGFLAIENVQIDEIGKDGYTFTLEFGQLNKFDIVQREIMLRRKSSSDDPVIPSREIDTFEALLSGVSYPDDLSDARVTTVTATEFTVQIGKGYVPSGVINYEVRTDDTGWGQPNYVTRFSGASYTFSRSKRDVLYYIRPYNASGKYARRSAVVRVLYPLQNNITVEDVDGLISPVTVTVDVPMPRDPDFAGIVVRRDSASGPIIYDGDGLNHREAMAGVDILTGSGYITLQIPNPDPASRTYTVYVNTYNLLGLYGTPQTKTITKVAPVITVPPLPLPIDETIITWSGTADRWRVTVYDYAGNVVDIVILPGEQTWFNIGAYGQQRTVNIEAIDDFDDYTDTPPPYELLPIPGDSDVPGALSSFSVSVVASPNNDGRTAFRISWGIPATNSRLIEEYEVEWADNSGFTSPDGLDLSPEQFDYILYAPGETLYFRARAKGRFGNGSWSTAGPYTANEPLDALGAGGDWSYGSGVFDKDIRVADTSNVAGKYIREVNDGTGRSLTGLALTGDIARNVPNAIRYLDSLGSTRIFIHNNNAVNALTNGTTVETGADRGINALNSSYRLVGNIENAVRYYDAVGTQRIIIHNNNDVASLTDGVTVTGGATRANTGLASNGDISRYIPRTVGGYDAVGNPRTLFLADYDSMDQIVEGGTYAKTTYNQRDGGGRGYIALNGSNVLVTGVQGAFYYPVNDLVEGADRGTTGFERMVAGYLGRVRSQDDTVDGMSIRVECIGGAHIVDAYRDVNTFYEGGGSGFERPPEV